MRIPAECGGLSAYGSGEALAAQVPGIYQIAYIDIANVFSKDSSNIDPTDWIAIINASGKTLHMTDMS